MSLSAVSGYQVQPPERKQSPARLVEISLDCHPGDALALAIRAATPILAAQTALAHACPVNGELRKHAVRRWLAAVSPADFVKAADPRDTREERP